MRTSRLLLPAVVLAGFAVVGRLLGGRDSARYDPIVQCSKGHLYRSLWLPLGSLKAIRWFGRRYQWCPVGRHWSWTRRVDPAQLSPDQLRAANAVHDLRVA